MTTPPTPAGWYPDPEQAGQLRYWDGITWTEHRSPVQEPPAPVASEPSFDPPPQAGAEHVGSHRAPDAEPEPLAATEQPTTKAPLRDWTPQPPPELSDWASEPAPEPITDPTFERAPEQTPDPSFAPPPPPLTEQATTKVPLREPAPYADATTSTPPVPPVVEPPAGTEPQTPVDNRKLLVGFGGAVAGLLLVLVLAAVYAFVIHKPDTVQVSSPTSETSTTTTEEETTTSEEATESEAATPLPGAGAADGPLTFSVVGVESGTTITDSENEFLTKDAQGEFIVVRLTVQNTSPDPGQFLGTFQKLNAGGQVYSIDDEATFYVGGGFIELPPGAQADIGLAYDVPPGTVPESIELHADPISPGVVLPLG